MKIYLASLTTTIIVDNFGVHPERPIDHSIAFQFLFFVSLILMIIFLLRYFIKSYAQEEEHSGEIH